MVITWIRSFVESLVTYFVHLAKMSGQKRFRVD